MEVNMVKWRTAQEAYELIKKEDEGTSISRFFIMKLANEKLIRSIKTGRKLLVDFDSLIAYLNDKEYEYPPSQRKL